MQGLKKVICTQHGVKEQDGSDHFTLHKRACRQQPCHQYIQADVPIAFHSQILLTSLSSQVSPATQVWHYCSQMAEPELSSPGSETGHEIRSNQQVWPPWIPEDQTTLVLKVLCLEGRRQVQGEEERPPPFWSESMRRFLVKVGRHGCADLHCLKHAERLHAEWTKCKAFFLLHMNNGFT